MFPIGDDNSTRRIIPFVTYILILLNLIFFAAELNLGDDFMLRWAFIPQRFMADPVGDFPTLFSALFLHAGWLHIIGNMLYLWIFGDNVEDRFGHLNFLLFYLLCGLAATLAQLAVDPYSPIPTLGASGAIAGVLGAYILMFPLAKVRVFLLIWVIRLPALVVLGFWILLQLFGGVGSIQAPEEGGVAYMAHIGGFAAGFILTFFFRKRANESDGPFYR
jgi:membrane associated rhomboid family serine protease